MNDFTDEIRAAIDQSREQKAWFLKGEVANGNLTQAEADLCLAWADALRDAICGKEAAS